MVKKKGIHKFKLGVDQILLDILNRAQVNYGLIYRTLITG